MKVKPKKSLGQNFLNDNNILAKIINLGSLKESDIILSLLNSGDIGITKEEVMSQVWMLNPNIETHTFETHLYRLRKKIKENLFLNNFIINEGGRFYLNQELIGKKI